MKRFFANKTFGFFVIIVSVGVMLCGILWKEKRFNELAIQKSKLVSEVSVLRGEVVLKDLENRELRSMERISQVAKTLGLDFVQVPWKIKPEVKQVEAR